LFSDPHKTNTLCGQNVEFVNVKPGDMQSTFPSLAVPTAITTS